MIISRQKVPISLRTGEKEEALNGDGGRNDTEGRKGGEVSGGREEGMVQLL